jgi:hypothetical protein
MTPKLDYPLLPELLADGGPLVLAGEQIVPLALRFLPRHQLVKWGDVEYHAVVQVGTQVELRSALQTVAELAQVRE